MRLLFVCIENSCRSQMAQAFAKILGDSETEVYSAGSAPSGVVNPKAIASMAEVGYNLAEHDSKSLNDIPDIEFDAAITMGCGDACPNTKSKKRLDWNIPDPKNMAPPEFAEVRDLIRQKVAELIKSC